MVMLVVVAIKNISLYRSETCRQSYSKHFSKSENSKLLHRNTKLKAGILCTTWLQITSEVWLRMQCNIWEDCKNNFTQKWPHLIISFKTNENWNKSPWSCPKTSYYINIKVKHSNVQVGHCSQGKWLLGAITSLKLQNRLDFISFYIDGTKTVKSEMKCAFPLSCSPSHEEFAICWKENLISSWSCDSYLLVQFSRL